MTATAAAPAGPIETDAVIIGAGPVGLFQVFELGLLEVKAHVIDALTHPGGQPVELYPDKPIFDIPGIPVCTGRQLTESLLKQIEPFGATFHLGQLVTTLQKQGDDRFIVETSGGTRFLTKTVFIAAGVGAFQPRSLKIDGLDKYEGTQLFYRVSNPTDFTGKHLLIAGGDDVALDWALKFAEDGASKAASVTLLHRRDRITAAPASLVKMAELCEAKKMQFKVGQITAIEEQSGRLSGALVTGPNGDTNSVPLDALLVFLGLSPKLGPIADWSLAMERKQVVVDTEKFSTTVAGIFAVGDINTYPGKKKLLLSGFHEATLAAFGAMPIIFPEKKILLQYTTASPRLHALLGVGSPATE